MVDTQPGIALERAPPIFPEAIDGLTRVQMADRVGPSLFQQPMIGRFHLGCEQRVVAPALGRIEIEVGRHTVEVARDDDRGDERSEERRVGKAGVSTWRYRWGTDH